MTYVEEYMELYLRCGVCCREQTEPPRTLPMICWWCEGMDGAVRATRLPVPVEEWEMNR